MPQVKLVKLRQEIEGCQICAPYLPHGVRPVLQVHAKSRILIAGQAPGAKVHQTGIPFDDASGDRLRDWMGIDRSAFYDGKKIAILPMGFCYPGKGKSGDLPPRPECAATWRASLLDQLPNLQLTLVIGQYALGWHLPQQSGRLTDIVRDQPLENGSHMVLPHPSPRNNIWLKKNPWFLQKVLPSVKKRVQNILGS